MPTRRSTPSQVIRARAASAPAAPAASATAPLPSPTPPPRQTVLVLQGGGALGAYQLGVYQALHEQGVEPDWVIGTSIGAINAALIAGNPVAQRLERLSAFWDQVRQDGGGLAPWFGALSAIATAQTVTRGIPGFFSPRPEAWLWPQSPLGIERASWYDTGPLRRTLDELLDPALLARPTVRLTVGAVAVASGRMRYFDSRDEPEGLDLRHVLASGALPPAFAAVRIGNEAYWDGGLYSNTPIEAVFDDNPRRHSLIFDVNVWQAQAPEPDTLGAVLARQKDIQYASRDESHIARQAQIHHLRHVIRALSAQLGPAAKQDPALRELAGWGCGTTMHVVHLDAPRLPREDAYKDIDFSAAGIRARREAGHRDTLAMLARAPWQAPADPMAGIIEHRLPARP
jgi:NTE family protein